jgi:hypothetical protein
MPVTTVATQYGYRCEVNGALSPGEARAWFEDIRRTVGVKRSYCQLIDLRKSSTHPPDTKAVIQEIMQWNKTHGMQRSAIILASAILKMQTGRERSRLGDEGPRLVGARGRPGQAVGARPGQAPPSSPCGTWTNSNDAAPDLCLDLEVSPGCGAGKGAWE